MKRRRKKILGLPIGPQEPSMARRIVPPAIAVAGVGAAALVASKVMHNGRTNGDPSAQARSTRADLQHQLKSGDVSLEEALDRAEKDDAIARTRVKILLQSLPGVGPRGAVTAMEELGIDSSRRVKGLGSHQREELLERFAGTSSSER